MKIIGNKIGHAFLLVFLIATSQVLNAQYTTDKVVGKKHVAEADSLKTVQYKHLLPIWGEKVTQKGFKLPKSAGISAQYLWQNSDILINNLQVGFNDGPMYNLDEIIRFNKAESNSNGISIRPDIWLFPFLNVYGVFAKSELSTDINAGVWIPDDENWKQVATLATKANFDATTYGLGMTPTVGVGGFFLALDFNCTWSDIAELEDPAFAFIFGPRIGKNIAFKRHPETNIALWVGGFRLKLNSGTNGSLSLGELFPIDTWQSKIDTGTMKVSQSQEKVDDWWAGLTPTEQKNPVNKAKYETANGALTRAGNVLNAASQAVDNAGSSSVQYSLDKKPKDMWNFIVGSQFQINRSWMIRAEYGFFGSRSQFLGGVQYRFNL